MASILAVALLAAVITGDGIDASLTGAAGDPVAGRAIVSSRQTGLCVLCHAGPFVAAPLQGTIGPDLRGVGSRLSVAQIRLRVADARLLDPASVMPSYRRVDGMRNEASAFAGKPILTDAQIEDVVAYLATLQTP